MNENHFFKTLDKVWLKEQFPKVFQRRNEDSHKGTYGSAAFIGGSQGMAGALVLAGTGALKIGCGKVFLGFLQTKLNFDYVENVPELMLSSYQAILNQQLPIQAVGIGCGLGSSLLAQQTVQHLLAENFKAVVLDADALNILAKKTFNATLSPECHILTPHPAEAARLLQQSVAEVQANRVQTTKQLAAKYQANVILKGSKTITYSLLHDEIYINSTGNCALATAGSGDVLTGILVSLLAQGIAIDEAIKAAVYMHGLAADWLVSQHQGPIGLTASEIIEAARLVRNEISYHCLN